MVRPVEETDPEFASLVAWCVGWRDLFPRIEIAQGSVRRVYGSWQSEEITETDFKIPGRNEPCFCGSGKKFKKCCENT
jgi:uncharacterized protein YchJ